MSNNEESLTERQLREIKYHREHSESHRAILEQPFDYDVVLNKKRRWWNHYWEMYTYLLNLDLNDKNILVIGCGFGEDAILLSKAGAKVMAFDLSPESLSIASELAEREGVKYELSEMAAEKLEYEDDYFDIVIARDILHHVEIPKTMNEILRVSKNGAIFCFNEVYSHSIPDRIRYSSFIDKWLYPKMIDFVYDNKRPYITEDERKLTEKDVDLILSSMLRPGIKKYFNFFVTRIIPEKYSILSKLDRLLLIILFPISFLIGSRVLVGGALNKSLGNVANAK